jgi:hypothetical protein
MRDPHTFIWIWKNRKKEGKRVKVIPRERKRNNGITEEEWNDNQERKSSSSFLSTRDPQSSLFGPALKVKQGQGAIGWIKKHDQESRRRRWKTSKTRNTEKDKALIKRFQEVKEKERWSFGERLFVGDMNHKSVQETAAQDSNSLMSSTYSSFDFTQLKGNVRLLVQESTPPSFVFNLHDFKETEGKRNRGTLDPLKVRTKKTSQHFQSQVIRKFFLPQTVNHL